MTTHISAQDVETKELVLLDLSLIIGYHIQKDSEMKLNTLKRIYDELNETQFAGLLYRPVFYGVRNEREYASYVAGNTVASEMYFHNNAIKGFWARSIVYHEMVHQYLEEYLGIEEDDHHGPKFWKNYRKFAPKNVILFDGL